MSRADPSMLGSSKYPRSKLDHYPTERPVIVALIRKLGLTRLVPSTIWEPFCGDGAISNVLAEHGIKTVSTDIKAYRGFDPDALFDFEKVTLAQLIKKTGIAPTGIISNSPYGRWIGHRMARRCIEIMRPIRGDVALLYRADYDTAGERRDLFDHPAYAGKITLRWRPRWKAGSTGSPRHSYAWYLWSWSKDPDDAPIAQFAERPTDV
jgi:hypothetical protein